MTEELKKAILALEERIEEQEKTAKDRYDRLVRRVGQLSEDVEQVKRWRNWKADEGEPMNPAQAQDKITGFEERIRDKERLTDGHQARIEQMDKKIDNLTKEVESLKGA